MPKLQNIRDVSNITTFEDLKRYLAIAFKNIEDLINGNLLPQDNFRSQLISCDFSAADSDTQFEHQLGKIPQYYLVFSRSTNLVIYDGVSDNTNSRFYLRSSAAGSANVLIF